MSILMGKELEHRHGGMPGFDISRLSLPEKTVLDFSVNLNPLGPPEIIRERWFDIIEGIEEYPTLEGDAVTQLFQEKLGIPASHFLAGNGSTELIYLIPRVLGFREVVIISPAYNDYARASRMAGAKVTRYDLLPENGFFSLNKEEITGFIKSLENADAIWLGNPNNPTGTLFSRDLMVDLAEEFPQKWLIIDEAFMAFAEEREATSLLIPNIRPNMIVIFSLTKFYSLAGLRLGGTLGAPDVISRLREFKEPWTVNGLAEKVAPFLLQCGDYEEKTRSIVKSERQRLLKTLKSIDGIIPFESSANFILCRWELTDNLDDLLRHLLANGIYVRDCRNFRGLENNFFRLAVRTSQENDLLIDHISSFRT